MCAGIGSSSRNALVDPEAGDFKRAALPAHEELTLAFAVVA